MRDWTSEFERRQAQPLVIFTQDKFQVDSLVPADLDVPVLLDPASTMSATYGVALQLQFREGTLPWSARPATLIIDRAGVLRYADDYEDRSPLWTPLQLLDDLREQRSLIESMQTVDQRFRPAVELALAPVGPDTKAIVPVLLAALGDKRSRIRVGAAAALYWIASGTEEAVPPLAQALADEDPRVRRLAALALGRIGKAAEPHLVRALKHHDTPVRVAAAWDLSRPPALGPTALAALIAARADERGEVRVAVVRSLVRLPLDRQTRQPVLDALATALTDATETVRHDAAYGLSALGSGARPAIPLVTKALQHQQEKTRVWARIVLGAIGPDATSALLALLKDGRASERGAAATALGQIHADDHRVVPALLASLADESRQVRALATTALGDFGPKARDAVGALLQLLQDEDQEIRLAAAKSLKKIEPQAAKKAGVP